MEFHHFLDVFHLLVLGQFHTFKYGGNHLHAHVVVVIEGPSVLRLPFFGTRLAYIMQQSGPTEPELIAVAGHVVKDLKRMKEHILVTAAIDGLNALQGCEFREYEFQQSASVQINESLGGNGRQDYLVEFFGNTLTRYYPYSLTVFLKRCKRSVINIEVKLSGKPYATHHAQGIVTERDFRVQRSTYNAVLKVIYASERINQLAKTLRVETYGHGVDGKVTAVLVILKSAVLYDWITRLTVIGFLAGTYKLNLQIPFLDLCCSKILEQAHMGSASESTAVSLSHLKATAYNYNVNILTGAFQKEVTYISSHNITLQPQTIGSLRQQPELLAVKQPGQFLITI